jgi:hypothetical protein
MRSRAAGAARGRRRIHGQVHAPHEQVGADQYERPVEAPLGVIPGLRNREGHDEQRRHRNGHGGTHDAGVGPGLVAKPGVRTPGPPQQRENKPISLCELSEYRVRNVGDETRVVLRSHYTFDHTASLVAWILRGGTIAT